MNPGEFLVLAFEEMQQDYIRRNFSKSMKKRAKGGVG
jgi:hypothetical protein